MSDLPKQPTLLPLPGLRGAEPAPVSEEEALEALALASAETPPPELRDRVLQAVAQAEGMLRLRRSRRRWRVGAAAALSGLAAAGAVLGMVWSGELRLRSRPEAGPDVRLMRTVRAQERELHARGDALSVHAEVVRIMSSPGLVTAVLDPESGHTGSARVLLDPDTGAVALVGRGLPPPDAGQAYVLWALRQDRSTELAGVFSGDRRSFALRLREVKNAQDVVGFQVSLEDAADASGGGGAVVLRGAVAAAQEGS